MTHSEIKDFVSNLPKEVKEAEKKIIVDTVNIYNEAIDSRLRTQYPTKKQLELAKKFRIPKELYTTFQTNLALDTVTVKNEQLSTALDKHLEAKYPVSANQIPGQADQQPGELSHAGRVQAERSAMPTASR